MSAPPELFERAFALHLQRQFGPAVLRDQKMLSRLSGIGLVGGLKGDAEQKGPGGFALDVELAQANSIVGLQHSHQISDGRRAIDDRARRRTDLRLPVDDRRAATG